MTAAVLQHLIDAGALTPAQRDICVAQQRHLLSTGERLTLAALVARNRFAPAAVVAEAQAQVLGVAPASPTELLPPELCARAGVVPVGVAQGVLTVRAARRLLPAEQRSILAACREPAQQLTVQATDRLSLQRELQQLTADVRSLAPILQRLRVEPTGALLRQALEALLAEAIRERASDIHLDRLQDPDAWVSYRVDGRLQQRHLLPARTMAALATRIMSESGMDPSNSLVAQDGRLSLRYQGRSVDYRVNVEPIAGGSTVAMRVLDAAQLPTVEQMFPAQPDMQAMLRSLAASNGKRGGLVIVTGATGSGKSTTLNALAQMLPRDGINLMTVEDPVEYVLPFARQIQLNALLGQQAGDFERSLLRQDPDVILLGEIRDAKSAKAALAFAESGHLVLATLHAESATEVFSRIEGFFESAAEKKAAVHVLAQQLLVVMHQRLVPRLCHHCATPLDAAASRARAAEYGLRLTLETGTYARLGCARCNDGTKGRALVHETLRLPRDPQVRAMVYQALASSLSAAADLGSIDGVEHITRADTVQRLLAAGELDLQAAQEVLI